MSQYLLRIECARIEVALLFFIILRIVLAMCLSYQQFNLSNADFYGLIKKCLHTDVCRLSEEWHSNKNS